MDYAKVEKLALEYQSKDSKLSVQDAVNKAVDFLSKVTVSEPTMADIIKAKLAGSTQVAVTTEVPAKVSDVPEKYSHCPDAYRKWLEMPASYTVTVYKREFEESLGYRTTETPTIAGASFTNVNMVMLASRKPKAKK